MTAIENYLSRYYRSIPRVLLVIGLMPAILAGLLYLKARADLTLERAKLDALTQQSTHAYQDFQKGFTHIMMDMSENDIWDQSIGRNLVKQGVRDYKALIDRYRGEHPELEAVSERLAYIDGLLPVISQSHQALHHSSYDIFLAVMAIDKSTGQLAKKVQTNTRQLNRNVLRYATLGLTLFLFSLTIGFWIQLHFFKQKVAMDRRLSNTRKWLAHYAESSQDLFWVMDPVNRRLEYVSQAYSALFGVNADPVGQPWWSEAIDPRDRERMSLRIAAAGSQAYQEEYRIIDAQGECRWVRERAQPIDSDDDAKHYVVGVSTDISLEKEHQQGLMQAEKMEAIGHLSGGLAHDFNNILAVIIGNLSLVQEELDANQPLRPMIDCSLEACDRGQQLTRALLDFARGETGNLDHCQLNPVIEEFLPLLKSAVTSSVELSLRLTTEPLEINTDRSWLENALLNLCINARDAMPEGGQVRIRTYRSTLGHCDKNQNGAAACIQVTDTGLGIPESIRDRIFEPFFTTKTRGNGTGMGLAMVYAFVRRHNGQIKVWSEPGRGTTFRIWIPLAQHATKYKAEDPNTGYDYDSTNGLEASQNA